MRKNFEHILLSILLGLSVLLGLSFWLNTIYGFNLFDSEHWAEISRLQAEQIPISSGFYISIGIAILIFAFGLCVIYIPKNKREYKQQPLQQEINVPLIPEIKNAPEKNVEHEIKPHKNAIPLARPPRLNLPTNMAEIAKQKHESMGTLPIPKQNEKAPTAQYDSVLSQIFADAGYVVKKNPTISGFTPNVFAIAQNEILWLGAVDADINKLQSAIDRLDSIFKETLEDIKININAFIIDTKGQTKPTDSIIILNSLDEFKKFVSELPPVWPKDMSNYEQDNFDAYSEYIDTIIQYVKNIG